MNKLNERIKKRIETTHHAFEQDATFSYRLAVYRMVDDLSWRLHMKGVAGYFHRKKDDFILKYIFDKLQSTIERFSNDDYIGERTENSPIWVCWWSGEADAPALVQQCLKSIRHHAGKKHPVYLITAKNYEKFLEIPDFIIKKVNDGTMCVANFSDYLRASLLAEYGGLWLDATIFCSQDIPEEYFEMPVFTCKSEIQLSRYLPQYRWTSFCLGGWKGSVFYRFFKTALEEYWRNENQSIDYLLVDYLIETAYKNISSVRMCMENIPTNNLRRDDLQAAFNACLPANQFNLIVQDDTVLYKLSWREHYLSTTPTGEQSVYEHFLEMKL